MTKKDLEKFATEFGTVLRDHTDENSGPAWLAIWGFCDVAHTINPRFDRERFQTWVREVRDGVRDLDGKRIA